MEKIVHSDWYCPDEKQANYRLMSTEGNSFVIRPSTNSPSKTPFTLCTRINNSISSFHIQRNIEPGVLFFTCSLTGEKQHPTMFSLVQYILKFYNEPHELNKELVSLRIATKEVNFGSIYQD